MISILDPASLVEVLADPCLDADLRTLLLRSHVAPEDSRIFVIEGGDSHEVICSAIGLPVTTEGPEALTFDAVEDHGFWFEMLHCSPDGIRTVILVENGPATDLGWHYACLSHFWLDGEGEAS